MATADRQEPRVCPRTCRCWPRPGPFDPDVWDLLDLLRRWVQRYEYFRVSSFGPCATRIADVAATRSADRVGYVLSTPLLMEPGTHLAAPLVVVLVNLVMTDASFAIFVEQVLRYGVCLRLKHYSRDKKPFAHQPLRHHPALMLCPDLPAVRKLSFRRVETQLLAAGAYPLQDDVNTHAHVLQWWRWHGRARRRQWVSLCACI